MKFEKLKAKYYEGQTSLQEETELKNNACSSVEPSLLKGFAAIQQQAERNYALEDRIRHTIGNDGRTLLYRKVAAWSVAASFAVMFSLYFLYQSDEKRIARQSTQLAMNLSNSEIETLQRSIAVLNRALNSTSKIRSIDNVNEQAQMIVRDISFKGELKYKPTFAKEKKE